MASSDRMGDMQRFQQARFPTPGSGVTPLQHARGQIPVDPEKAAPMPKPAKPDWQFMFTDPVLTLRGVTVSLGMEPSQEQAFQKYLTSILDTGNEVMLRQNLINYARDKAWDPMLRRALLQRALSYYRAAGHPPSGREGSMAKDPYLTLEKAGALFIGPRGGKWADAAHTIPWSESAAPAAAAPGPALTVPVAPKEEFKKPVPKRTWINSVTEVGLPLDTQKHFKEGGDYTPERKAVHEKVYSKFLDKVPSVPEHLQPTAVVMMGGSGSGKGTVLKHIMGDTNDFVNVNADDCKEELPEYQKAINLNDVPKDAPPDTERKSARDAAAMVHEESSDMSKEILKRGLAARKNIILDGTGKNADSYGKKIDELRKAGYHVRLVMPHIDMDDARQRVKDRADRSGRYVPDAFVEEAHHIIPGNFETLAQRAHEAVLFDNSKPPPRAVMTIDSFTGQRNVKDQQFVDDFQKLGKERHAVAKQRGWMKAMEASAPVQKTEDAPAPSVPLDDFLERFETNRGEAEDTCTGIDPDESAEEVRPEYAEDDSDDDNVEKAQPRGGNYHRRIPDKDGFKYVYSEDEYNARPDAHVDGKAARMSKMRADVLRTVGKKGTSISGMATLVKRYGAPELTQCIQGLCDDGNLFMRGDKLLPAEAPLDKANPMAPAKKIPLGITVPRGGPAPAAQGTTMRDSAAALKEQSMVKSGEGSRGGHVIGHTGSGKPIYSKHDHPAHASFTAQDHKDAADKHFMANTPFFQKYGYADDSPHGDETGGYAHLEPKNRPSKAEEDAVSDHTHQMWAHFNSANPLKKARDGAAPSSGYPSTFQKSDTGERMDLGAWMKKGGFGDSGDMTPEERKEKKEDDQDEREESGEDQDQEQERGMEKGKGKTADDCASDAATSMLNAGDMRKGFPFQKKDEQKPGAPGAAPGGPPVPGKKPPPKAVQAQPPAGAAPEPPPVPPVPPPATPPPGTPPGGPAVPPAAGATPPVATAPKPGMLLQKDQQQAQAAAGAPGQPGGPPPPPGQPPPSAQHGTAPGAEQKPGVPPVPGKPGAGPPGAGDAQSQALAQSDTAKMHSFNANKFPLDTSDFAGAAAAHQQAADAHYKAAKALQGAGSDQPHRQAAVQEHQQNADFHSKLASAFLGKHGANKGPPPSMAKSEASMRKGLGSWLQKANIPGTEGDFGDSTKGSAVLPNTRSGQGQSDGIPGAEDSGEGAPGSDLPSGDPTMVEGKDVNGGLSQPGADGGDIGEGDGGSSGSGSSASSAGGEGGIPGAGDEGKTDKLSEDDPPLGKMPSGDPGIVTQDAGMSGNDDMDVGSLKKGSLDGVTKPTARREESASRKQLAAELHARTPRDSVHTPGVRAPQEQVQKGEQPTVSRNGLTLYSNASDIDVERFMKGGDQFYEGGVAPSIGLGNQLQKSQVCKSCGGGFPQFLSACPGCGNGGGGEMKKSAVPTEIVARRLTPRRTEGDIFLPAGLVKKRT